MISLPRLLFAGLALAATGLHAASFEPLDIDQLSNRAEQIFVGTVEASTSGRAFAGQVVTDFTFVDVEPIKGADGGSRLDVRMLGGTVGDATLSIAGAPTFHVGERYVIFMQGNGRVMFPTLGGPAGIYPVRRDPLTGQEKVFDYGGRPLTALPFGDSPRSRPKDLAASDYGPAAEPMQLEAFVAEIRKRIAQ
jgi:hypothetical protein